MIRLLDPDGLLIELIASSLTEASNRGQTAPLPQSMRFAVFTAYPPRWKVTRELHGYLPKASATV